MVPVDLFDELYSTSCHLISMSYFFDEMVLYHSFLRDVSEIDLSKKPWNFYRN